MNGKKLALIGAIALIILGCVVAAGCTSTTSTYDTTSCPWVGLWMSDYKIADGTSTSASMVIKADGTAEWTSVEKVKDPVKTDSNNETWKKTGENTFTLTNPANGTAYNYVYDAAKDTLTETNNGIINVYTRTDPILGTWGTLCKDVEVGTEVTTFLADGTGKDYMAYFNGDELERTFTWTKTGDNTYKVSFDTGDIWQAKLIDDSQELDWKLLTLKDPILGTRTCTYEQGGEEISDVTTFNDDYTGVSVGTYVNSPDTEKMTDKFTWKKIGINTYVMNYGELGSIWIGKYNKDDNTVEYTHYRYSDEPIIGTREEELVDYKYTGTSSTTYNSNGTGTGVDKTKDGSTVTFDIIWKKVDTNKYSTIYIGKNSWEAWTETYIPQTKTFGYELDKCLWVDNYRIGGKHRLDIHLTDFENGTAYEYDSNGEVEEYETTWEQIKDNIYKVTYNDGDVWTTTYHPSTDTYTWEKVVQ